MTAKAKKSLGNASRTTASIGDRQFLPKLDDIPIPVDAQVGITWPEGLQELALWIGTYDALRFCEVLGGEHIYISTDPALPRFASLLSADKRAILAHVYGGSRYAVPTAAKEIRKARRAAVTASVRAKTMTRAAGAQIIGTSRTYMAYLVNSTSEGVGIAPITLPEPKALSVLKQAADNVVAQLGAAGVNPAVVAGAWAAIMAAWGAPSSDLPTLVHAPAAPGSVTNAGVDHG